MGLKRISGLFLKDGRDGAKFMTGNVRDEGIPPNSRLLIFKNNHKRSNSDPDYVLHLADGEPGDNQTTSRREPAQSNGANPYRERAANRTKPATEQDREAFDDFEQERADAASNSRPESPF